MRYFLSILAVIIITTVSSCRKDFTTIASFGQLEFSRDTVFLDTVFTNIGSATYNLKVYNRSNKAITIPQITLENGTASNYRLNVDGKPGKSFENIDLLANDSMYVFIETTIDFSNIPDPLYTDRILFDNGNNQQDVDLVTLVQDATFIFPDKDPISMKIDSLSLDGEPTTIKGRFLEDSELIFTKDKPYVIYGYAAIPSNKTLIIEAGAKIHFHDNSGLIVDRDATLKVNGTLDEKVVFEGDRLESSFSRIPGQWGTIWMRAGSKENEVNHAQIKNGVIGFLVDSLGSATTPTLKLQNTEVYNHVNFGILGSQTNIEGNNVVIGSAGQASFAGTAGGTYNFTHSTFANYWSNSLRRLPTVLINNFSVNQNDMGQEIIETQDLQEATFTNCIIEGNNNIEFVLDKIDGSLFNYNLSNCLIRFNDINGLYTNNDELKFDDVTHYQNIILNGTPGFKSVFFNEFIIGEESDAINKATPTTISLDILGTDRTSNPDIGAYQHISFQ
ncbi:hypothetical protein C7447_104260 [Tenacibaculum adriaticum]|uniref:Parallel beta helix pectate lyase-like protein n=1 Tax=Tenacibaculum adriaticum TaxID=413713 RepID=A0A5S5DRB8_9FLAO|nr:hypothetical protein [Tenacibaculum adriaticum]TYP97566.1 hypothetical protein C7447_104260 [Tenacibaculum adriaticum]